MSLEDVRARVAAGLPAGPLVGLPAPLVRRLEHAERLGAPLLGELDRASRDAEASAALAAEVRVATAQTRAVAAGLLVAPVVLVPGLGRLLALDLVGFYGSPTGRLVGLAAGLLHVVGMLWVRWIVSASRRRSGPWHRRTHAGAAPERVETVELVAVGIRAGLDPPSALRSAASVLAEDATALLRLALDLDLGSPGPAREPLPRLAACLRASVGLGAPVAGALDRLADALRREQVTVAREAAARLPALLTAPTALLVLPASLLSVGAPLVVEALRTLGV